MKYRYSERERERGRVGTREGRKETLNGGREKETQ